MVTLRCTKKLLDRLGIDKPGEPGPATAKLGDWYATILHTRPAHLVVLIVGEVMVRRVASSTQA